MKGPGLRLKCDVRRIWRCPDCGSEVAAGGNVTALRCQCENPHPFMQLIEPRRRVRPEAAPLDVYFECAPEDEPDALPTPASVVTVAVSDSEVDQTGSEPVQTPETVVTAPEAESSSTPEFDPERAESNEQAMPAPTEPGHLPPATIPTTASGPAPDSDKADEPQRKRKRKSRGGRRRRGRSRKSDPGSDAGPTNPASGPAS